MSKQIKGEYYFKHLEEIKTAYQKNNDWNEVIATAVYSDVDTANEAFIDYIEEVYQTKVKDAKHLQKLTGIKSLLSIEPNIELGKEPTLEDIITSARYSKYFRALEKALQEGAKYKDLLQIKPQDFGLSKDFKRKERVGSDQYNSILWALYFEFTFEPGFLMLLPDLRSIAQEIEAPYSVLMDCYKLTN